MAFCANCGTQMDEGVKFCPSCGTSITGKPAKPTKAASAGETVEKTETKKGNPFLAFSKPYMEFIDKGKLFGLVYIVMAVVNLLIPFAILYVVIDSGFLKLGIKYVAAFIFTWLVVAFAFWIGFQIWLERRKKIANYVPHEFSATPVFSEILQTFGEWLGTITGIVGAGGGLIATIFFGNNNARSLLSLIGMGFLSKGNGILTIIIAPVTGFFIVVSSRFVAEQLRIFAALANNTKEIATNIKNKDTAGAGA